MSDKIVVFIHAAILPRCEERVNAYIERMIQSGMFEHIHEIFVCYLGPGTIPPLAKQDPKVHQVRVTEDLSLYEIPTHFTMWSYAREHPDAKILYLHTKGVGKEINLCIEDWVNYMTYFLINKWERCLENLKTYETTGVDLRPEPTLHYSGNFWWANARHIANLPNPIEFHDIVKYPNPLNSDRHNQEFWICYIKGPIHTALWDSGINVYQRHVHRYPEERYAHI